MQSGYRLAGHRACQKRGLLPVTRRRANQEGQNLGEKGAGRYGRWSSVRRQNLVVKNVFVERVLPGSVLRGLTEAEMTVYRRPFAEAGEDRRPTLTWPRQIPIAGEPADVTTIAAEYGEWLQHSEVKKLFVNAEPGAILTGKLRERCRSFPNQTEVTVAGSHFIQEDSPDEIGQALAAWL